MLCLSRNEGMSSAIPITRQAAVPLLGKHGTQSLEPSGRQTDARDSTAYQTGPYVAFLESPVMNYDRPNGRVLDDRVVEPASTQYPAISKGSAVAPTPMITCVQPKDVKAEQGRRPNFGPPSKAEIVPSAQIIHVKKTNIPTVPLAQSHLSEALVAVLNFSSTTPMMGKTTAFMIKIDTTTDVKKNAKTVPPKPILTPMVTAHARARIVNTPINIAWTFRANQAMNITPHSSGGHCVR